MMAMAFVLGTLLVAAVAALIAYSFSPMCATRSTLRSKASILESEVTALRNAIRASATSLDTAVDAYVDAYRARRRGETPIESLRDAGADRVRWGVLQDAGIRTLADLDRLHPPSLLSLPGVGQTSAAKITFAADALRRQITAEPVPLPGIGLGEPKAPELVSEALRAIAAEALLRPLVEELSRRESRIRTEANRIAATLGPTAWVIRALRSGGGLPEATKARALTAEIDGLLRGKALGRARINAEMIRRRMLDLATLRERYAAECDAVVARVELSASGIRFVRPARASETISKPVSQQRAAGTRSSARFGSDRPRTCFPAPNRAHEGVSEGQLAHDGCHVKWVPPGEAVVVRGISIPGGMMYVGPSSDTSEDPCFIDPALPIDLESADRAGAFMNYWPSYSTIAPSCRTAYLQWLAGGRRDPSFDIGYAFLFFYGLERRLLREREHCAHSEVEAILDEVDGLLAVYRGNRSFRRYAGSFLETMRATLPTPRLYDGQPPTPERGSTPIALKVGLGQALADGKPLPAAWALAWYFAAASDYPGYAASRCPDELARLFEIRYAAAFGRGFEITSAKGRLSVAYRPASATFPGAVDVELGLPLVPLHPSAPERIVSIVESCVRDLEGYARSLARKSASHPLARIALLPEELAPAQTDDRFAALRRWLEEIVPVDTPVLVLARDLFTLWSESRPARLSKKEVTQLGQVLGRLGFGIDPDPRFGGGSIIETERVGLFRLLPDSPSAPTDGFSAAVLLVRLCAAVASADNQATVIERERVEQIAAAMDGLEPSERQRLRAYALRLFETRPALGSVARRVAAFPLKARERLGALLIGVAAVDGQISSKEIAILVRLYSALGLDAAAVYREAHARTTDTIPTEEPVVVRRPQSLRAAGDYVIPLPQTTAGKSQSRVRIDEQLLARKQEETDEVLAMLAPYFDEETCSAAQLAPRAPVSSTSDVAGLDTTHAALLRRLAERASWDRADVEAVCEDLGLLTDGALEILNDAAFERVGGPILEGEDPLEADLDAIRSWLT